MILYTAEPDQTAPNGGGGREKSDIKYQMGSFSYSAGEKNNILKLGKKLEFGKMHAIF